MAIILTNVATLRENKNVLWKNIHLSAVSSTLRVEALFKALLCLHKNCSHRKFKILALLNSGETQLNTMYMRLALISRAKTII